MVAADRLPRARLDTLAATWRVTVERIDETPTALCTFGTRDGDPVVLKVAALEGNEWSAGRVLSWGWPPLTYDGRLGP